MSIPDGVVISGEGPDTQLIGPAAQGGSTSVDGLRLAGSATVRNLMLGFFRYNAVLSAAAQHLTLEGVTLAGSRTYGIYVTGANARITLENTDVRDCTGACVYLQGTGGSLSASGGRIASLNNYGIRISGNQNTLELEGTTVRGGGTNLAIYVASPNEASVTLREVELSGPLYFRSATGTLDVIDSRIELLNEAMMPLTSGNGIDFGGATARLNVRGSTIVGGGYGVRQSEGAVTLRDTAVESYNFFGYYITQGTLDMGTETELGGNSFQAPAGGSRYGLYDGRAFAIDPITVSDTTFNGFMPSAQTLTRTAENLANEVNRYRIVTIGNSIVFY